MQQYAQQAENTRSHLHWPTCAMIICMTTSSSWLRNPTPAVLCLHTPHCCCHDRRGFSAVVGTQTTATCQAMQAALPALSSGDPEAAARALHTVLSAVLNSINSGDAATGTKALHAALKMNPTHDEATLLLQQLLQLHKTKQPQQQQPQQQQQQQPVANSHATSITTASTSSGGSSSSTVDRSSSIGGRRSSEGSESRSTSIVVRNPVTATSTSSSTTSTTAGSTPPTSELHDLEDFDAISLLVFSRREKLWQHLGSFDGSTAMSREWVGEALRLKQQMVSSHAHNLVGWWCSLMDYFSYWMLFCCLHMARWAGEWHERPLKEAIPVQ